MISAFARALSQLGDPAFRRPIGWSIALAALVFAALWLSVGYWTWIGVIGVVKPVVHELQTRAEWSRRSQMEEISVEKVLDQRPGQERRSAIACRVEVVLYVIARDAVTLRGQVAQLIGVLSSLRVPRIVEHV